VDAVMRVVAVTLAALALGTTIAGAATPPRITSGLRGVVMRGPTSPVCFEAEPCEEPAAGVVLQFWSSGTLVARARTGPAGGYSVRLRPGRYAVRTGQVAHIGTRLTPDIVRVPRGQLARVDFHIDTGIQ
jgi:hypothetical protein